MTFPGCISMVMVMVVIFLSTGMVDSLRVPKGSVPTNSWMSSHYSIGAKNQLKLTNDPFASYNDVFRPHAHTSNEHNQNERQIFTELQSSSSEDMAPSIRFEDSNPMILSQEFSEPSSFGLSTDTENDTFIESLEFAKSVVDTTTTLLRVDILLALSAFLPFVSNFGHMISSSFLENDLFANTIIPAMALYLGNILFIIFL